MNYLKESRKKSQVNFPVPQTSSLKPMYKIFLLVFLTVSCFSFDTPSNKQIFKTSLQVTVRNELGNLEEGAKVTLYKTEEDYNATINPVGEAKETDKKGRVLFEGLEPLAYFVQAEKGDLNNFGAGEKTPELDKNKINKVTIIISE